MEKNVEVSLLLDFYGALLKEKHFKAVDLYCNSDLSLSETAEELNITRQGARDLIKRAENALYEYENRLGLYKRYRENERIMKKLAECIDELEIRSGAEYKAEIEQIKSLTQQLMI